MLVPAPATCARALASVTPANVWRKIRYPATVRVMATEGVHWRPTWLTPPLTVRPDGVAGGWNCVNSRRPTAKSRLSSRTVSCPATYTEPVPHAAMPYSRSSPVAPANPSCVTVKRGRSPLSYFQTRIRRSVDARDSYPATM